jgi:carboxypeptidase Taq
MQPEQAYQELLQRTREAALLESCIALLGWDEETYMPHSGVENRSRQLALLTGLHHERLTHPRLGELLDLLEGSELVRDPHSIEAVNVRQLRRQFRRQSRLPRRLVEELARVTTLAQQAWADALHDADHERFRPWLERVLALKIEEARAMDDSSDVYDVLLDEQEPGLRSEDLVLLFARLRPELTALVGLLLSSGRQADVEVLSGDFPIDRQRTFGEMVAGALGFDLRAGRLDSTTHPFCASIGPGDCRITTRYNATRFNQAFFSTLHEVGHALYEQGLPPEHYGTPAGEVPSVALHESQSRLWENTVGRSAPFWQHFFPLARQIFHEALAGVTLETFHFAVNHVEPTLIRVQADEVTYNLHILVRFELERALVHGDLKPIDLPAAWSEAYRRDLGIEPANDREGCLQDGHWSAGLFGYFPTYTLGNVFAAQLYTRAQAEMPDLDESMACGDFRGLLDWLRQKVHHHGGQLTARELIEQATGEPPDPRFLLQMLRTRFGGIYGV